MRLQIKRAYDVASKDDGYRVLVDRLWPRGVSKDQARIDLWMKEIAPSTKLRQWFAHDPERWSEFRKRYFRELDEHPEVVEQLQTIIRKEPVTLVYAAKDEEHNDAVALQEYLEA